jgi:hypothetical protein
VPASNIAVMGARSPDGGIILLAYESRDNTIVTVVDGRRNVTWRARRPEDERRHDPWAAG